MPAGLLALVAVLALLSRNDDHVFGWSDWLGARGDVIAISHQGAPVDPARPDVAGFVAAANLGFRYIESDVRLIDRTSSADGAFADQVLVAFHDVDGNIASLEELRSSGHDVATVEDLLLHPEMQQVRWNFELKGGTIETARELSRILDQTDSRDEVCVSFGDILSQQLIAEVRDELDTCFCASFLERTTFLDLESVAEALAPFRSGTGHTLSCVQLLHQLVTERDIAEAHEAGIAIHVWELALPAEIAGVDLSSTGKMSAQDIHRFLDWGVDGIITDDPKLLREVLRARGEWPE